MIRLTLIVLFLLACCAPAALAQKPQRGRKVGSARPISIELPFCEQVASAKDFEYRAEQTELSVSLAKPDAVLKTTLHYRGKCMVWQHYSTDKDSLVDRVTAELPRAQDGVTSGAVLLAELDRAQRRFQSSLPFKKKQDIFGTVFCGAEIKPLVVRSAYADLARRDNFKCEGLSADDCEMYRIEYERIYKQSALQLQFVGSELPIAVPLRDVVEFHKPGRYRLRLGYVLYPDTTRRTFNRPLERQEVVWTQEITVTVTP